MQEPKGSFRHEYFVPFPNLERSSVKYVALHSFHVTRVASCDESQMSSLSNHGGGAGDGANGVLFGGSDGGNDGGTDEGSVQFAI